MKLKFRELRADELEARIARITATGAQLLLYKNARCDMKVLDESVGPMNWQRDHKELKGNMYAGIGIYDESKKQWVWKWDCGAESNMEGQKGEASDSFKRAGFNWGIGRELYTAPFIWFPADQMTGKKDRFEVKAIEYTDSKITYLQIYNAISQVIRDYGKAKRQQSESFSNTAQISEDSLERHDISENEYESLMTMIKKADVNLQALQKQYKVDDIRNITRAQYMALSGRLERALTSTRGNSLKSHRAAVQEPQGDSNYQQMSMNL